MRLLITLSFLCIALTFFACSEGDGENQPLFVVEAFIFSGEPVQGIRIKELTPLDSGSAAVAPVIDDALVVIVKNGIMYPLNFDVNTGSYFYPNSDLIINTGDEIRLQVDVNGKQAYGETLVPPPPDRVRKNLDKLVVPPLTVAPDLRDQIIELFVTARLTVEWDSNEGDLQYVVIESLVDQIDAILPDIVPEEAKELLGSFRFISEPTENTSFDVVGVALETYGTHTAKVYRVNEEYADLFRNDTQDSRDLNAPPTNMVGAFGIFSSFASDSVVFEVVRE